MATRRWAPSPRRPQPTTPSQRRSRAPESERVRRYRIDLAYDGTRFSGWARQPGRRTVQECVEGALATVVRRPVRVTVAGRTDAGVHATGQVCHADLCHADLPRHETGDSLRRRLNGVLPADVRVLRTRPAPPGFDARFSALSRSYAYRVSDRVVDPLRRHDTAVHPRPLDVAAMAAAADRLLGEHDFAAYCRARPGATTVRALLRLTACRTGGVVVLDVEADAFCHGMVRSLAGALLAVGDGRRPVSWPRQVLDGGTRDPAVMVAPALGLTLRAVRYPPPGRLAERAALTRNLRATPATPATPSTPAAPATPAATAAPAPAPATPGRSGLDLTGGSPPGS